MKTNMKVVSGCCHCYLFIIKCNVPMRLFVEGGGSDLSRGYVSLCRRRLSVRDVSLQESCLLPPNHL